MKWKRCPLIRANKQAKEAELRGELQKRGQSQSIWEGEKAPFSLKQEGRREHGDAGKSGSRSKRKRL